MKSCIDHINIIRRRLSSRIFHIVHHQSNTQNQSDLTLGSTIKLINQQEVPSTNNVKTTKNDNKNNKQNRQASFQDKNAPWTNW